MTKVDVFGQQQSPLGEAWRPLAESTIRQKRQNSSRILVDTGGLVNAVHAEGNSKGIRVGVNGAPATYGVFHQFGRRTAGGPGTGHGAWRRPFLPMNSAGTIEMFGGPAKRWRDRTLERLKDFIIHGRV